MNAGSFPASDEAGLATLEIFSKADHFNRWLFDAVAPYCSGSILEIGSGIGNLSIQLLTKTNHLVLTDVNPSYISQLKSSFADQPSVKTILLMDIAQQRLPDQHPELIEAFDTVIALNVVEHLSDDAVSLRNCHNFLRKGGNLIVLVPAYQWLYNSFDRELGHYHRYSRKQITTLFTSEQFSITEIKYFNAAGIFGWWFNGSILKKKIIPATQLKIFDRLVPGLRLLDSLLMKKIGLSVITVAKK